MIFNHDASRTGEVMSRAKTAPWWAVTLRRDGDDEDSCYVVQAKDEAEATRTVERRFRKDAEMPRRTDDEDAGSIVYINYVLRCGKERPEIVRAAGY